MGVTFYNYLYFLLLKIDASRLPFSRFQFQFILYRKSQLNLRNFECKIYPFGFMCFSLDGS